MVGLYIYPEKCVNIDLLLKIFMGLHAVTRPSYPFSGQGLDISGVKKREDVMAIVFFNVMP